MNGFCNYLSNRKQFVQYNLAKSPTEGISCGVPQGSILEPLLFILYMNHICYTSKFWIKRSNELKEVCWFKANKLSLNAKKTILMPMGTSKQTSSTDNENVNIYLDGCKLSRVRDAKFLWNNNRWKFIVEKASWRYMQNMFQKHRCAEQSSTFLPNSAMYQLYCTLVLPLPKLWLALTG